LSAPERVSSELAKRPDPVSSTDMELYKEQVRMVATTDFVPASYRGKPHAILAAILYGREIGLEAMESLSEVAMVDGRPSLSAKAMVKLARRAGHSITGDADDKIAVAKGKRGDNGDEMTVKFTYAQAAKIKRKGKSLVEGDNWKNYPEDMLWARAVSRLCRRLFADTFGALPYAPEELAPHVDNADGRMQSALDMLPEDETVVHEEGLESLSEPAASVPGPAGSESEDEPQSLGEFLPDDVKEQLKLE
jgi:hypothetical protein